MPPRRLLLVKPSALGDVVHGLPVLSLLRRRFPETQIHWLIAPAFAPILRGHPADCRVIHFDRRRLADGSRGADGWFDTIDLARRLAALEFDLVIDLQGLLRSALLTLATHAPVRAGFETAREGAPLAYTHRVPSRGTERHAIERYLDVAEYLGCGRGPIEYHFPHTDADRATINRRLAEKGKVVVLLPGTNWDTKKWPVQHYAQLAARLRHDLHLTPVVAGGPDAVPLARQIPDAINLAGQTTLPELCALLERADLVVANDSGPMHIACAMNRPLVTIFGPTNPIRTGPHGRQETVLRLDIACSPCYARSCAHTSCMHWLSPEMVLAQCERALVKRS
jgi:heptosyltransferase I